MSFKIERAYMDNGLNDYRLKNIEDISNVHGVNVRDIKGYDALDDLNKALYEKFIVNFYNAFGLDSRATIIPKGIYFVEDTRLVVKESPNDEFFTEAGFIVKSIDKYGKKRILHKYIHGDYKNLEIKDWKPTEYLRVEYKHQGRNEWLHIKSETQWY